MVKENLEDRVHWLWASCAEVSDSGSSLAFKESSVTIPGIDATHNPVFTSAGKRIKGEK